MSEPYQKFVVCDHAHERPRCTLHTMLLDVEGWVYRVLCCDDCKAAFEQDTEVD
jgi:hypothetical protein